MLCGMVALRIGKADPIPVSVSYKVHVTDALYGKVDEVPMSPAEPEHVRAPAIRDQRIGLEVVLLALAGKPRVIDPDVVLADDGAKDRVELSIVVVIVLEGAWDRIELAVEILETLLLMRGQVLETSIPEVLNALFHDGAFEEPEQSQREVKRGGAVRALGNGEGRGRQRAALQFREELRSDPGPVRQTRGSPVLSDCRYFEHLVCREPARLRAHPRT